MWRGGAGHRWPSGSARWAPAPRSGAQGMRAAGGGRVGRGPGKRGSRVWPEALRAREPCVCGVGWGRGAFCGPERTFVRAPRGGREAGASAWDSGRRGPQLGSQGRAGRAGPRGRRGSRAQRPLHPGRAPGLRRPRPGEAAPRPGAPTRPGQARALRRWRYVRAPDTRARVPRQRRAARSTAPAQGQPGAGETNVPRARGARDGRTRGDIRSLGRVGAARPEAAGPVVLLPSGPGRSGPPPGKPGRGRGGRGSERTGG